MTREFMDPGLAAQLAGFREARRELEASVLPLATSVDGRRFSFHASLYGLPLQVGGYVVRTQVPIRYARGEGVILDELGLRAPGNGTGQH
jgi:hypothetical protein